MWYHYVTNAENIIHCKEYKFNLSRKVAIFWKRMELQNEDKFYSTKQLRKQINFNGD